METRSSRGSSKTSKEGNRFSLARLGRYALFGGILYLLNKAGVISAPDYEWIKYLLY